MFDIIRMIENSLTGYSEAFRVLASNVQNFQTDGYKKVEVSFQTIFQQQLVKAGGSSFGPNGGSNTVTISQGATLLSNGLDFRQAGLREGLPLNAAISAGSTVFVLQPGGAQKSDRLYSRSSAWQFDANGTLIDTFQRPVLGYKMVSGQPDKSQLIPIKIDPNQTDPTDVGFEAGGILTTNYAARKTARNNGAEVIPDGTSLFQVAVAKFANPSAFAVVNGNAFRESVLSGPPLQFGVSGDTGLGVVSGGFVESSNVNPAETTIQGIQYQRGFNAIQSALQLVNRSLQTFVQAMTSS